jgi:cell fate (sporulation/competence/biofilm development) regulator YmcA (YheA/YmcA/DUF963 family)
MSGGLSIENLDKIKTIAKTMGTPSSTISDFDEEGVLTKFLEEYKFDKINEIYINKYNDAMEKSESEVASARLENFPLEIDYDSTLMDISKLFSYIYQHNLKDVQSFNDFLEYLGDNNDLDYEDIDEVAHNNMDFTDLNYYIGSELDDIIEGFDDPYNQYYGYNKSRMELNDIIKKYGFSESNQGDIIASRNQDDKVINILDYGYDEDDEKLKIQIRLVYKDGHARSGWIYGENIYKYVGQFQIPSMRENRNKK